MTRRQYCPAPRVRCSRQTEHQRTGDRMIDTILHEMRGLTLGDKRRLIEAAVERELGPGGGDAPTACPRCGSADFVLRPETLLAQTASQRRSNTPREAWRCLDVQARALPVLVRMDGAGKALRCPAVGHPPGPGSTGHIRQHPQDVHRRGAAFLGLVGVGEPYVNRGLTETLTTLG